MAIDRARIDRFHAEYVRAALWSEADDAGNPLDDRYSADDIDPATMAAMRRDCVAFLTYADDIIGDEIDHAAHDLWLTRQGHGCGFWDGDWPEDIGVKLTELSGKLGVFQVYIGDDGKIHGWTPSDPARFGVRA